jgi:hypothetical protein
VKTREFAQGGIFGAGGRGMPSPLVAAESQYPSRFHGSTFFQPQSVPSYTANPMYVPGLGDGTPEATTSVSTTKIVALVTVAAAVGIYFAMRK